MVCWLQKVASCRSSNNCFLQVADIFLTTDTGKNIIVRRVFMWAVNKEVYNKDGVVLKSYVFDGLHPGLVQVRIRAGKKEEKNSL